MPSQTAIEETLVWRDEAGYTIEALAEYEVSARVLSARSYSDDREADVSPVDLALGWGQMADREMLSQLQVTQRDRWYFVRWRGAPIRAADVIANSANTHLLPADEEVAEQLERVGEGDIVHLRGYLVSVEAEDGWHWESSLSRFDTGDGSCEVLWVESVEVERDEPIIYASID